MWTAEKGKIELGKSRSESQRLVRRPRCDCLYEPLDATASGRVGTRPRDALPKPWLMCGGVWRHARDYPPTGNCPADKHPTSSPALLITALELFAIYSQSSCIRRLADTETD